MLYVNIEYIVIQLILNDFDIGTEYVFESDNLLQY